MDDSTRYDFTNEDLDDLERALVAGSIDVDDLRHLIHGEQILWVLESQSAVAARIRRRMKVRTRLQTCTGDAVVDELLSPEDIARTVGEVLARGEIPKIVTIQM
ncbi:MAG: hypothetical protein KDB37_17480 [Ilumatobacter sp.]|nr:hypothetical protein [Ilumatobacter sp.]